MSTKSKASSRTLNRISAKASRLAKAELSDAGIIGITCWIDEMYQLDSVGEISTRTSFMRIFLSLTIAISASGAAFCEDRPKVRPATESEILDVLRPAGNLKQDKNGYQYREGSRIGYKISEGKICVLQQNKPSCVTVYSDGKRLEMIDARGHREFLN